MTPRTPRRPLRVGLLGCGAINSRVAEIINCGEAGSCVIGSVLVTNERSLAERTLVIPSSPDIVTTSADVFFASDDWSLCIEAAGQPAVVEHAKRCLELGRDFMITSIGALTEEGLYDDLYATAEAHGSRLILCTGSLPAVDWMGAAALADSSSATASTVTIIQTKPPRAWLGTPAETDHPDLLKLTKPRTLFEGPAREATTLYPKNANVTAMLALATVGFSGTTARLVADPQAKGNLISVEFQGAAGKLSVQVEAAPSSTNPRTSAVVALSVIKAVRKLSCPVVVGL